MVVCAVPGCFNNQKNCDKTFFKVPKNEKQSNLWIKQLTIRRKDTLPKIVLFCEDHFTDDCFDKSADLYR